MSQIKDFLCFFHLIYKNRSKEIDFFLFTLSRAQKEEDLQDQEDTSHAKKHKPIDVWRSRCSAEIRLESKDSSFSLLLLASRTKKNALHASSTELNSQMRRVNIAFSLTTNQQTQCSKRGYRLRNKRVGGFSSVLLNGPVAPVDQRNFKAPQPNQVSSNIEVYLVLQISRARSLRKFLFYYIYTLVRKF